jgi:hypothetical protein
MVGRTIKLLQHAQPHHVQAKEFLILILQLVIGIHGPLPLVKLDMLALGREIVS